MEGDILMEYRFDRIPYVTSDDYKWVSLEYVQGLMLKLKAVEAELAQHKPPDPKFRIGQIVRVKRGTEFFRQINSCNYRPEYKIWEYIDTKDCLFKERELSAIDPKDVL
jgi:hypothetical protein